MDAEQGFTYETLPVRVMLADGALLEVPSELERLGRRRAVIVAGARHREAAGRLAAALGAAAAGVFPEVVAHVPEGVAERFHRYVTDQDADAVVSVGGGSATGLAKYVARTRSVAVVAVPTTYSGSEMTPIWGTTGTGGKQTGRDPGVVPDVVVYDPELTRSLPPGFAATSGLNAVAHCVEAFYAPGHNPITDLAAAEGLRRLSAALPRVVAPGDDPPARREALLGACLAGIAIAQTGTSFHHKTCHVLGGRFGLPHADTHAVLLAHSVRAAVAAVPHRVGPVASALGVDDPVAGVVALAGRLGAPDSLAELGMAADDLDEAVDLASDAVTTAGIDLSRDRLDEMLRGAWAGRPGGLGTAPASSGRRRWSPGHQRGRR